MTERVTGIGGVFFRSPDPRALTDWYAEHLGIEVTDTHGGAVFPGADGTFMVWSAFEPDTEYFAPGQRYMINYRVDDLDAMLDQLRDAGVRVDDEVEDSDAGRFGWAYDLDGNRFELWPPR